MNKLTFAAVALTTIALQGCIIYEDGHDGDCGWEDDCDFSWDDDLDWCDEDGNNQDGDPCDDEVGDEEPEPAFDLYLDPGHAELGETFLAHVTAEGEFDIGSVTGVRFTGGVEILYTEVRETEVLVLIDVPAQADLGLADLVVSRADAEAVLMEGALLVAEPGSGNSANDCE